MKNWDKKTKYAKATVSDILSKRYWGKVEVAEDIKKMLHDNEWHREQFRRGAKRIGGYLWTMNKHRKDDVESKRIMYFDKVIQKGQEVETTFMIDANVVVVNTKLFELTKFRLK